MRLAIFALGSFAIGTDTFVMAGILGGIGSDLRVSTSTAALLVTVFALAYALLSPLLATATASWPRRRVLLTALTVFTVGNAATALAPGYGTAMAARVLTAAGAAMYVPNAAAAGASLVPPERRARALAIVSGGLGVAMTVGAPVGTWLGGHTGWRNVMWLVTVLGAIALAGVAVAIPQVPDVPAVPLRERLRPLGGAAVQRILVVTFVMYVGVYSVYPYLGEVLHHATGGAAGRLAWLLTAFGLGSLIGSAAAGPVIDRYGSQRVLVTGLLGIAVAELAVATAGDSYPVAFAALVVWGVSGWSAYLSQQHRLIALAPHSAPVYVSLNSSAQYIGVAAGSAVGGPLLGGLGAHALPLLMAGVLLLDTAFAAATGGRRGRTVPVAEWEGTSARVPALVD